MVWKALHTGGVHFCVDSFINSYLWRVCRAPCISGEMPELISSHISLQSFSMPIAPQPERTDKISRPKVEHEDQLVLGFKDGLDLTRRVGGLPFRNKLTF